MEDVDVWNRGVSQDSGPSHPSSLLLVVNRLRERLGGWKRAGRIETVPNGTSVAQTSAFL